MIRFIEIYLENKSYDRKWAIYVAASIDWVNDRKVLVYK
jgi:hypothetical protein